MREECKYYSEEFSLPVMKFRPATTDESLRVVASRFKKLTKTQMSSTLKFSNADTKIYIMFKLSNLLLGYITKDSDGVWVNPSVTKDDEPIMNARKLDTLRNRAKKLKSLRGNIYIGDNGFGFAEYSSFRNSIIQDAATFVREGLARVLDNTTRSAAGNLSTIANKVGCLNSKRVEVLGFHAVESSASRAVALYLKRKDNWLCVDGNNPIDGEENYAFGIWDSGRATHKKSE